MIRPALPSDIPAVVIMVERLHAAASVMVPFDAQATTKFLAALISLPQGLVLVLERDGEPCGFLAASIGFGSTSPLRIAVEHGWWAQGGGSLLLSRYEAWARENGCHFASMCSPPGAERVEKLLVQNGYTNTEVTWAKALQ